MPHDRAVDEAAALGGPCALEAAARSIRRCVQVARVAASGPLGLTEAGVGVGGRGSAGSPWKAWRVIRQKVLDREMPPWGADPAIGVWANDRSLNDEAIATIVAWADGGAPRGDRAALPPLPAYADSDWTIGKPDAVFSIPPFEVPPEGTVEYTYFEVPTNLTEDKWVTAVQVRPGAAAAVHHVIVTARAERSPEERADQPRVDPGFRLDYAILPGQEAEWNPGVAQLEGWPKGDPLGRYYGRERRRGGVPARHRAFAGSRHHAGVRDALHADR